MTLKIRGLSLTRPWPFAFTGGPDGLQKRVENRSWFPNAGMMGHFLALHAAKGYSEHDREFISEKLGVQAPAQSESPHSQIFAVCRVVALVTGIADPRLSEAQKDWFFGPFGWLLDDFVILNSPVQCSGARGLWDLPNPVVGPLRQAYLESAPGGLYPTEPILWEHPALKKERAISPEHIELSDYERRLQE
jgi:hypothetical protein